MDKQGVDGAGEVSNGQKSGGKPDSTQSIAEDVHEAPMTNGDQPAAQTDGAADDAPKTNGNLPPPAGQVDIPASLLQLPPDIRVQGVELGLQPLGKLLERVSQTCWNDLLQTIEDAASISVPQPTNGAMTNGTNHAMVNGTGDTSTENVEKKNKWLEFANSNRERMIKMLVLSQWARQAEDVRKLIDLKIWGDEWNRNTREAVDAIARLKLDLQMAKVPSPDIKTAFEVLSTGKDSRVPDLGYIPPEPLTPEQILKTLKNLNTLLSIRINLHEELPPYLKNWSIASGKATFVVAASGFEFDVSIADEDPASQFYFINIRFLFTPAPDLPDGPLREEIGYKANELLATFGLTGCCQFLHDFVLTHKISVLRRQAFDMSMAAWAESLRVEPVHRSLVVQYWTGMNGPKSWIEIGVASGRLKRDRASRSKPSLPYIVLRWRRNGKEVADVPQIFDWNDLSMERIMKQLIALHTNDFLGSLRDALMAAPDAKQGFVAELSTSQSEPADCALRLRLGTSTDTVTVKVDPVVGHVTLRPSTPASAQIERDINNMRNPMADAHTRTAQYLCINRQVDIEREAERSGWTALANLRLRPEALRAAFKQNVLRYTFFRGQGWGSSTWVIGATLNLAGESWWAVQLENAAVGESIVGVRPIPLTSGPGKPLTLSESLLEKVERLAIAEISLATTTAELRRLGVAHTLLTESYPPRNGASSKDELPLSIPSLTISFSQLFRDKRSEPEHKQWALELLRLTHNGFERREGKIIHVIKGVLAPSHQLKALATNTHDEDVAFHPQTGTFTILLRTPFGTSCVTQLTARLAAVARLRGMTAVLRRRGLPCDTVTLARLVFTYAPAPAPAPAPESQPPPQSLKADLSFRDGAPIRAVFLPGHSNPHRRVAALLAHVLNHGPHGFEHFARALHYTLPLLRGFDAIETPTAAPGTSGASAAAAAAAQPAIHPRAVDWYRVVYTDPAYAYDVRMRVYKDKPLWYVEETAATAKGSAEGRPQGMAEALVALRREKGRGWLGLSSAIVAGVEGVEEVVGRVDGVVRRFAGAGGEGPTAAPAVALGAGAGHGAAVVKPEVVDLT